MLTQFIEDGIIYEKNMFNELVVLGLVKGYSPKEITIPPNVHNQVVSEIAGDAFRHAQVEVVNIPFTIRVIRSGAFSFCTNLKSVTIPFAWFESEKDTLCIEPYSFIDCWNLKSFTGNRAISVQTRAFQNCYELSSLEGLRIQRLEKESFFDCASLHEAVFCSSVIMPSQCLNGWALNKATFLGDAVMHIDVVQVCKNRNIKIVCDEKSNLPNLAYEGLLIECYGIKDNYD